jgi:Tol biopolymer transport system component
VTTAITDGQMPSDMPAFSPDGQRIAFVGECAGVPDLFIANVDGTHAKRVFDRPARRWRPVWLRRAPQRA